MIDHIEIYVTNLPRSTEFWGWLLEGMGYAPYQSWPAGRSWKKDEAYIVLVQTEPEFIAAGYHRKRVGLNHLAFQVSSRAEVDALTTALRERGVTILYIDRHPYASGPETYAVFFEDPDRIKVEVVARV